MLMMLNACEIRGLASTSTLTTSTAPSYFAAIFSISGATILHGPHQVAQKSTTTGFSFLRTSCSKVSSVACWMAMGWFLSSRDARGCACGRSGASGALAGEALDEPVGLEDADVGEAIEDRRSVAAALDETRRCGGRRGAGSCWAPGSRPSSRGRSTESSPAASDSSTHSRFGSASARPTAA